MTNLPAQPKRMQQLRLFPSDEPDALIYQSSDLYRRLDDTGQKIVRGYLMALQKLGDWPKVRSIAEMSGVSKSTVSARLQKGSDVMAAITDVLSSCRDDMAIRTSILIPALAGVIGMQFFPTDGKIPRDTRTLTTNELKVLQLASIMGGARIGGPDGQPASLTVAAQTGDGTAVAAKIEMPSQGPSLEDIMIKLRQGVSSPPKAESSHEMPETVQPEEVPTQPDDEE